MKSFNIFVCTVLILSALFAVSLADSFVEVHPGPEDITIKQAQKLAVSFFAEKCGIEEDVLRKADWTIQFGYSSVVNADAAHWVISVENVHKDEPREIHFLRLTPMGEVIEWSAHGGTYDKPNPDLLDDATPVSPLPTDVQADAVATLIREEMSKLGHTREMIISATFAYDGHFNGGNIPVWLVQIGAVDGDRWKAAVTHKGELLSLVPYEQVFRAWRTPGEEFWGTTFKGETFNEEHGLFYAVIECTLSHEEKAEITARWRTLVETWMKEHPYYLNNPGSEYVVTIERVYGVPDEEALPQAEAEKLAGAALTAHLGEAYLSYREVRADYLVNDPQHPVWVFRFGRIKGLSQAERRAAVIANPDVASMYNVTIDAYTGELYEIEMTDKVY